MDETLDPTPAPDADPDAAEAADQLAQACEDLARDDARFLKLAPPILAELRAVDEDRSTRILWARDRAHIAVFERLSRIARRDLPADAG